MEDGQIGVKDLHLSAYLLARGHKLLGSEESEPRRGVRFFTFFFPQSAKPDLDEYFRGGMVSGRAMGGAIRDLKNIIYGGPR